MTHRYATDAETAPTMWEQVRDIVDSLDGTPTRATFDVAPWYITPSDVEVMIDIPDLVSYILGVSPTLADTIRKECSLLIEDVDALDADQVQAYIRAVKSWQQDVERTAREVADALVLQVIYAPHHRPSVLLPAVDDEAREVAL